MCTSSAVLLNGRIQDQTKGSNGYLTLDRDWSDGDRIELELAMPVRFVGAHPQVFELAGQVAVLQVPLVFCAEEVDNGPDLHNLIIDPSGPTKATFFPSLMGGTLKISLDGLRQSLQPSEGLYPACDISRTGESVEVVLVPYHQWGNRKPGQEMRVWFRAERGWP